jgi:bifunctional non-homologous end joining protein LigD
MSKLKEYRNKRRFESTPEPQGSVRETQDRAFVVQKHAATRLHYDLRLEIDGVLKSWAVPKGPSMNPADKRLAVHVEDHPFEYKDFEGSIPKGLYGGGEVIVWDRGSYAPEGTMNARDQLAKGDLKFQLYGEKLRGSFVLVKLRSSKNKNEWLLIKHRDSFADPKWDAEQHGESVITGRTLEDIAKGRAGSGKPRSTDPSEITRAVKAAMPQMPKGMPVTLAQLKEEPFSDPEWLFEIKWDGVRTIAQIQDGKTSLWSRSGRDVTAEYPEFANLASHFRVPNALADGEIVTLDENGRSNFHKLQNRLGVQNPSQQLMHAVPVSYYFFDLPYANGYDLRKSPLVERKEFLKRVLITDERIHYSDHVVDNGEALFEAAKEKGLEGILAKRADSSYSGARTPSWIKLKIVKELDAVVAGYTAGRGSRKYFGALVLGLYDGRELKFIGSVGTGFDEDHLESLFEALQKLRTPHSPFKEPPELREAVEWVKPELVARVKYGNWTEDTHLRAPVFLSLRKDRKAQDCTFVDELPAETADDPEPPRAPDPPDPPKRARALKSTASHNDPEKELSTGTSESLDLESDGHAIHLTHLNKMFFPEVGLKKRHVLAHYYRMAKYVLPFLKDRALVLRRYPDGVGGKAFFQKEAPSFIPEWMATATVYSDERGKEMKYMVANTRAALLYVTNLGCIDHNPWSSRADSQDTPDYVFFDLDPTPDTPFSAVLHIAKEIHSLLKSIRLNCYLKTSGADGFHIFVPLEPQYTYEQARTFAEVVGRLVGAENPNLTTFERSVDKRPKGRILIDALQNARGKPLACVYSARAYPKAPVSTPIHPDELIKHFAPEKWNLKNIQERVKDVGDLWGNFWDKRQTLTYALKLLEKRMPKKETRRP